MDEHAVRKGDAARALGNSGAGKRKTGVAGRGQYKTWTPNMMLRASLRVCTQGNVLQMVTCAPTQFLHLII